MATKLQASKGTHDVLPDQAPERLALERIARRILEGAGYERIETPAFEVTELFSRGVGGSTDIVQKEMFTFEDEGGRSLTLRPEGTAPIVRSYLEHGMHKLPQPVKLWYWESFFRAEKPQAGRYRQFWQVGAEAIGAAGPAVDAELITLLHAILSEVGTGSLKLRLGSLGTPETRAAYRERLVAYLRTHEDRLSAEVVGRIDLNPLRAFDADDPGTREVMANAPLLLDELAPDDAEHFAAVRARLDAAGIDYVIDPTLVRGLDYYTRTLFEFETDALSSALGGGGRYDGLAEQLGGPATPGIGWAAGVERILLAAEPAPHRVAVCDLYVAGEGVTAFALASEGRRAGLSVQQELAGRSTKGALKQAARLKATAVAVVDDAAGTIHLKDTETGEQTVVPDTTAVIARALKGRHPG
ncbi:Histidine--tRNA ligase [Paraconexibacter sp. AEG42_29]|uniref:Histidine--tRNA ligase n=1 Tax=Paraconexibacter sp. AEG42_29 TaxID=2997339 RepID=A0AAU7AXQ4_9ACTN